MLIAIFCSVLLEGKVIIDSLTDCRDISGSVVMGNLYNKLIIVAITGVGKVNAAHISTKVFEKLLSEHPAKLPDIVISMGIGGAYPASGLSVGDIAVAIEETYGDEGVISKDGFKDMSEIGLPIFSLNEDNQTKIYNRIELDDKLSKKAFEIIRNLEIGADCKKGVFITVSSCSGTLKRAEELKRAFNGLCENMEGASIAHISKIYRLPMIEVRGISNIVEDRDKEKWNINLASRNCQEAVLAVLKEI